MSRTTFICTSELHSNGEQRQTSSNTVPLFSTDLFRFWTLYIYPLVMIMVFVANAMTRPLPTHCTVFPPSLNFNTIKLTHCMIWPARTESPMLDSVVASHNAPLAELTFISKPRGQVTEISKGGYSLKKALDWESQQYADVQVRCVTKGLCYRSSICSHSF